MYFHSFNRESSRVVIVEFPKIEEINPLSQQLQLEEKLKTACTKASAAILVILSLTNLFGADKWPKEIIEKIQEEFGPGQYHHRVIRSYMKLMY